MKLTLLWVIIIITSLAQLFSKFSKFLCIYSLKDQTLWVLGTEKSNSFPERHVFQKSRRVIYKYRQHNTSVN